MKPLDLDAALRGFADPAWDIREEAVEKLVVMDRPNLPGRVHALVTDKYSAILFCKYVELSRNSAGLIFLERYCFHEDREVQQAAFTALKRFPERTILPVLSRMIVSENVPASETALEIVADQKIFRLVPQVIRKLESPDPKVLIRALHVLEKIKDTTAGRPIRKLLKSGDVAVVRQAIVTLIDYDETKYWKHFLPLLNHPSAQIRRMAVWAVTRRRGGRTVRAVVRAARAEADVDVRQEAMKRLSEFHQPAAVDFLIDHVIADTDTPVRNMSKWLLNRVPEELRLRRYMARFQVVEDAQVRALLIELMGRLETREAFEALVRILDRQEDALLKQVAIEALAACGFVEAVPVLERFLSGDMLLGYSAVLSIGRLASRHRRFNILVRYLSLPQEENAILIQTILQFLSELAKKTDFDKLLWDEIIRLIYSENFNIRYLAIGLLEQYPSTDILERLLTMDETDPDSHTRDACAAAAAAILRRSPEAVHRLIEHLKKDGRTEAFRLWALDLLMKLQEHPGLGLKTLEDLLTLAAEPAFGPYLDRIRKIVAARSAQFGLELYELFLIGLCSKQAAIFFEILFDVIRARNEPVPDFIVDVLLEQRPLLPEPLLLKYLDEASFQDDISILFDVLQSGCPAQTVAQVREIIRRKVSAA